MNASVHRNSMGGPSHGTGDGVARDHLLLTVLGTKPRTARYSLAGQEAEATLAPIALLDLLRPTERPNRVMALCTSQAKKESWPTLEEALCNRYQLELVEVSAGDAQEDVSTYLTQVSSAVVGTIDLTVDVTHGYRHFSFLTYIAVLYLAALREVRIRGAYYGLLRDGLSPFLDLRPLLELPRWLHALEVLRDTGSTLPMAKAIGSGPQDPFAKKIVSDLSQFSDAYLSGLPLELGRQAHGIRNQCRKPLKKRLERDHRLPLAGEMVDRLAAILEPFALTESVSGSGWKRQITLSEEELKRQARVIDDLLNRESFATALGLMNEWAVSWVVWRSHDTNEWLDYRTVRRSAAGLLGAIDAVGRDAGLVHVLTDEQRSLGDFWRNLCDLRNAYHHHGMRPQVLVGNSEIERKLRSVRDFWRGTLRSCPGLSLSLGESPGGPILVSPIGRRPGVLFSAMQVCLADRDIGEPVMCLVICSRETEGMIQTASQRAGYAGEIKSLILEDPYGGRAEIERLVELARRSFVGAGEVFVNVTGGTTLMGLAAEALADAARKLACPVRRFGLIDRRPPEQQDANPYETGEPFWLDSTEDGDAGRD